MTKQGFAFPSQQELDNLKLNWKRYLLPAIHPEGVKILIWEALAVLAIDLLRIVSGAIVGLYLPSFWWIGIPLLVFSYYFFRNPDRVTPQGDNLIISPADGIVSNIKPVIPPKELGLGDKPLTRISVFMSVFNVHVNRAPVSGKVDKLHYRPGKFVNISDKDSEDNERQEICMIANNGQKIGFIQIAGLVARRIYCPLKVGDKLKAGNIFGMIRFGSRLDVFLPNGVVPNVRLGQIAIAGETILADMSELKTNKKKG